MSDKHKKIHKDLALTQAIVESVCDPNEFGNKTKYPFINYLPFKQPSKEYIELAILMSKYPIKPPHPSTIKQFRADFARFIPAQANPIKNKSKCKLKELFIKDKTTNNIVHAYCIKYEGASVQNGVIIDCHGGGYVLFDADFHFHFAEILSKLTKCVIILLNYKLAPEYPLPYSVDELVFLYNYVLTSFEGGVPAQKIAMMGDSAGGGMVLLGLQSMKYGTNSRLKLPQPACVWLNSPWVNLTNDSEMWDKYRNSPLYTDDTSIITDLMSNWAVGNKDGNNNVIAYKNCRNEIYSPQFGRFDGLAPMYFMVGGSEIGLLDTGIECAKKAYKVGVEVQFDISPYMPHCWPTAADEYPEAMESCRKAAKWIVNHLNNTNTFVRSKL